MKALLINPEKLVNPPIGLLSIGSMLKSKGHEVMVAETPFGLDLCERSNFIRNEIDSFRPDVVGITTTTLQASICKEMTRTIKDYSGRIKIVIGGVHPTVDSKDAISWGADIAVRGEGDETIVDVMKYLNGTMPISALKGISYADGTAVIDNPDRERIRDLDRLPPISYSLLDKKRFQRRSYAIRGFWIRCGWLITSRGCPGRCSFCASNTMHGRVVREFGMDRILDEAERLKKDYDIEGIMILDDTFTLKEDRVTAFCEGLKKRKIKVIWACQARVDTFTDKMAASMKSAGCVQIDFGVESGSQKVLNTIKKDIKCEETKRAFRIARDSGLRALATVMVGLPDEDENDLAMTEELIRQIKPDFVVPSFATPYPGTELYKIALERGWIDVAKEINWQQMEEPIMTMGIPSVTIKGALEKLLKYDKPVMLDYLKKPGFLFDILQIFAKNPKYIFEIVSCLIKGNRRGMVNAFLYVFRKEMLNN